MMPKFAAKEVEETVFWLELQGRARSFKAFDGIKRYVVTGGAEDEEQAASSSSTSDEAAKQEAPVAAPKETRVPKSDLLTNAEVCAMLDCTSGNPAYLVKSGRIEKRDGKYTRASVEAWAKARAAGTKPGRKPAAEKVAAQPTMPPRKSVKPPPKRVASPTRKTAERDVKPSKSTTPLAEQVRALAAVVDMGHLSVDVAWSAVVSLVR